MRNILREQFYKNVDIKLFSTTCKYVCRNFF